MFDEKTKQALKAYVYMLLDPTDQQPFYVGKGRENNRVFDHIACALTDADSTTLKYEKIRSIEKRGQEVQHVIVRHGLTDKEAFELEAALIDSLSYCGLLLTNEQGGHNSIDKGLMTSEEVKRLYNAQLLTALGTDCILININRTYKRGHGVEPIYQATKEIWLISPNRIPHIKYVLSEYRGLIVEVFEVDSWYIKKRTKNKAQKDSNNNKLLDANGKPIMKVVDVDGYGFDGKVAPDAIRNLYINKSVAEHKKRGAAQAIRFNL
jgi:hypothetical protein